MVRPRGFTVPFLNITYPPIIRLWMLPFWKKICCPKGWHLFDEVQSEDVHYLHCDACELSVGVAYAEKRRQ